MLLAAASFSRHYVDIQKMRNRKKCYLLGGIFEQVLNDEQNLGFEEQQELLPCYNPSC